MRLKRFIIFIAATAALIGSVPPVDAREDEPILPEKVKPANPIVLRDDLEDDLHLSKKLNLLHLHTLSMINVAKGLAMVTDHPEDLKKLNVSWWYTWGWCNAVGCIPMVRKMELPPGCPATLLVGNEPNTVEPYGAPLTPLAAVARVRAIEAMCPDTALVIGNVAYDDWSSVGGWGDGYTWIHMFLRAYESDTGKSFSHTLGVHCYSLELAAYCIAGFAKLRSVFSGKMWVTEFGILNGDGQQFSLLLDYVADNFDRYAAYTNRQPRAGQGWEIDHGVELINRDGTYTMAGVVYSAK
jgi:hypothetical protein